MLIRKLIIANRGEIAARVIRTAKHLGIATVAVHSEADARAFHLRDADERVSIGPAAARDSYLKIEQILAAAKQTGADAVHPGYGFLSENPDFAAACREVGLTFVGPPTEAIRAMGSKTAAREAAVDAGVPVLPGSAVVKDLPEALRLAATLGYPLLLKPTAGGGGIGMQKCRDEKDLNRFFEAASGAASRFFGDGGVYLERFLEQARHVEVQIAADHHGHVVHLGERECSIQRRHQKVMEETPSPGITPALRSAITDAAVRLAKHVNYASLGTVEMLTDGAAFYFLEMNTRLQVEHTITEMVTGLDLVEWQIRIAMGEALPTTQAGIQFRGHAFECRICAENPDKSFMPSPGQITCFEVPVGPGVRNDVGVAEGDYVTPYYDPMVAKLIVHAPTRAAAVERLAVALQDYRVEGIATNLRMHQAIVAHAAFRAGELSTHFLRERLNLKA